MTETPITHIERIEIKGLWGKYDIDWTLDPKVNILIGINGSGKTTLLDIIKTCLDRENNAFEFLENIYIQDVKISFIDNQYFQVAYIDSIKKLPQIDRKIFDIDEQEDLRKVINGKKTFYPLYYYNDKTTNNLIMREQYNLEKIKTFDMLLNDEEDIKNKNDNIKTYLDVEIQFLGFQFKSYLLTLKNKLEEDVNELDNQIKTISKQEDASFGDLKKLREIIKEKEQIKESINYKFDLFLKIINTVFGGTHKKFELDSSNDIIFKIGNDEILPYQLSSGEKQMLIILLKVLLQDNQPYILLLDEPEISMHISWQHHLVENIQKLNENCQLIIATHSPSLLGKVWHGKVVEMSDITQQINQLELV